MLESVLLNEREYLFHQQSSALASKDPVVSKSQAILIQYSRLYRCDVKWLDGSAQMEVTVRVVSDGFVLHHVMLRKEYHTPHTCCSYSQTGSVLHYFHGVAVFCDNYGSYYLHRFISRGYLTSS